MTDIPAAFHVGDLLRLHLNAAGNAAPAGEERMLPTLALVKAVENDRLLLSFAGKSGAHWPKAPGVAVLLQKPARDGILSYTAVVVAVRPARRENPFPCLEVKLLTSGKLIQRRSSFRVPVNLPVRCASTTPLPITVSGPKRPAHLPKTSPTAEVCGPWSPATLHDLSESGACVYLHEHKEIGEHVMLDLPIGKDGVRVEAVVRACARPQDSDKSQWMLALEFFAPGAQRQDRIRKFVFEQQRKLRQQRAEPRAETDREG